MLTVQQRAETKDYLDIAALLNHGVSLPFLLAAARALYGTAFEPLLTLKALCYYGEPALQSLSPTLRTQLCNTAKATNVHALPAL